MIWPCGRTCTSYYADLFFFTITVSFKLLQFLTKMQKKKTRLKSSYRGSQYYKIMVNNFDHVYIFVDFIYLDMFSAYC